MKLIFKKAFGFDFIPSDVAFWFIELEASAYKFVVDRRNVEIVRGEFGLNELEKAAINRFVSSGRRPLGHSIHTLDVILEIDETVPESVLSRTNEHGAADAIVEKYIVTAFHAVRAFVEAYRDWKYLKYRGKPQWEKKQTLLPRMTEHEFRTFLFYVLDVSPGVSLSGSFSDGEILMSEPSGGAFSSSLQSSLATAVPAERKFIQTSWERFFDEDYSGAVIYAAIAVERAMARVVRDELTTRGVGTASQIGKTVDDTSNRLLCTVILGVLGIADASLREQMVKVFELRNALAHGKKAGVDGDEARGCIDTAESFLTIAWE